MLFYQEIFASIQGEGLDTGLPTVFVRLFGCNLHCSYCDQPQKVGEKRRISVANIVEEIRKYRVRNVCITGGEPLLQDEVYPLIYELVSLGYNVSIETNGAVVIDPDPYYRKFKYVMDVKGPSSGMNHKNVYSNLGVLHSNDEVKFVIANREDYLFMKNILVKFPTKAKVLVSPMFDGKWKPVISGELCQWILEDKLNVRLQVQIHKILGVL